MPREKFEVEGMKALEEKLKAIPFELQEKSITTSLRAAANPMKKSAIANAQKSKHPSSGALSMSIKVMARKKLKNAPRNVVFLGSKRRDKQAAQAYKDFYGRGGQGIYHGHLIERGTQHSAAQPWMRPALDENKTDFPRLLSKVLASRIKSHVKRLKKLDSLR